MKLASWLLLAVFAIAGIVDTGVLKLNYTDADIERISATFDGCSAPETIKIDSQLNQIVL